MGDLRALLLVHALVAGERVGMSMCKLTDAHRLWFESPLVPRTGVSVKSPHHLGTEATVVTSRVCRSIFRRSPSWYWEMYAYAPSLVILMPEGAPKVAPEPVPSDEVPARP